MLAHLAEDYFSVPLRKKRKYDTFVIKAGKSLVTCSVPALGTLKRRRKTIVDLSEGECQRNLHKARVHCIPLQSEHRGSETNFALLCFFMRSKLLKSQRESWLGFHLHQTSCRNLLVPVQYIFSNF